MVQSRLQRFNDRFGKPKVVSYLLYEACFPVAKGDILIVAHKMSHAQEVMRRLKNMYYSIPFLWMKPGMAKNNETRIEFDNGMNVKNWHRLLVTMK